MAMKPLSLAVAAARVVLLSLGALLLPLGAPDRADGPIAAARAQTAATAPAATPAPEAGARREGEDLVIGRADAPVVVIEYASLTCPACARFHNDVLPRLKAEYVDPGHVKFVFRDFPLDRVAMQAAQIARCVAPERYFGFVELLFRQQEQWASGRDATVMIDRVKQYASLAGLPRDKATGCAEDQAAQLRIVTAAQIAEKEYRITGTPALVINGKRHTGSPNFEDLDKALRALLPKP
jgi:protein-disulfide isomerase